MSESRKLAMCGLEYRVVFATGDEVPELIENEGWCCTRLNTIYVRRGMPRTRTVDALVHEIGHGFIEGSGLGHFFQGALKGGPEALELFEETFIRLATPWIIRLVEDNGAALLQVPSSVPPAPTPTPPTRKRAKKGCRS